MSEFDFLLDELNAAQEVMKRAAAFLEALTNDPRFNLDSKIQENGVLLSQELAEAAGLND